MRSLQKPAIGLATLACLALTLTACGSATPAASRADTALEQTASQPPIPTASSSPDAPTSSPPPSQTGTRTPKGGVTGARDDPQPGVARAVKMCQDVIGDGLLQSAFMTTIDQIRTMPGSGEVLSYRPLWRSVPANTPAAWCSVRSGVVYKIYAVGSDGRVQFFEAATSPLNGDPGPAPR